jgi:hypothetical protein
LLHNEILCQGSFKGQIEKIGKTVTLHYQDVEQNTKPGTFCGQSVTKRLRGFHWISNISTFQRTNKTGNVPTFTADLPKNIPAHLFLDLIQNTETANPS